MTISAADVFGSEPVVVGDPKPVPLEPGSQIAQAIYRVYAGHRRSQIVLPGYPDRVQSAAAVAAVLANRSPWRVRLVANNGIDLVQLERAVRPYVNRGILSDEALVPGAGEKRPKLAISRTIHSMLPTVHVLLAPRRQSGPDSQLTFLSPTTRVIYITGNPVGWLDDPDPDPAVEEIPLDIVLAGAPNDVWNMEQPCL